MTPEEAEDANLECLHMGERRMTVQERRWERIPDGDDPDSKSTIQAGASRERNIARQLKLVGPDSEAAGSRGVGTGDLGCLRRNNAASHEDRSRQWSLYRYVIAES